MTFFNEIIKYSWHIGFAALINQFFSILFYHLISKGIICDACSISEAVYMLTALVDVLTLVAMGVALATLLVRRSFKKAGLQLVFYIFIAMLVKYLVQFGMINWYD